MTRRNGSIEPWLSRSNDPMLNPQKMSTGSGPVKLGLPLERCPDFPGLTCKMTELPLAQSQLREFLSTQLGANDRPQRSPRVLAG